MTVITPSAAARKKEANFVIDENLSLVGYVIAIKLNSDSPGAEELSLQSLRLASDPPVSSEDVVVEVGTD